MHNLSLIEEFYDKFHSNLKYWIPEDLYTVDIPLLQHFGLLNLPEHEPEISNLNRYFHIIESNEKMTLINEQFVIWIVPESWEEKQATLTLIAINNKEGPRLKAAFISTGVFNSSKLVLHLLEKFLGEIEENEDVIGNIKKPHL